jgi:hypothetical protein
VSTYDGWRVPTKGDSFDPAVDRTIQPASFFPAQPWMQLALKLYS